MKRLHQKRLTLVAVFGWAYWFFGNLYEAIVLSPNWVVDSPAQIARLRGFFVNTSPTLYFLLVTQAATVLVWVLFGLNKQEQVKRDYQFASIFALLSTLLNVYIVVVLIRYIFGRDYLEDANKLNSYLWRWNVLNVFRMGLVATTTAFLFAAFRKLDRSEEPPAAPEASEPRGWRSTPPSAGPGHVRPVRE